MDSRLTRAMAMPAPLPAEVHLFVALFNAGRYSEMEERAVTLASRLPQSGLAWKFLSVALMMQNKDALQALRKATRLLPGDAEAHCNLGNVLLTLGRHEAALASYRRALRLKPSCAGAHNNLGHALLQIGELEAAVASYQLALELAGRSQSDGRHAADAARSGYTH